MIIFRTGLLALALVGLAGCASWMEAMGVERTGASSSLVDYLYPEGQIPPDQDGVIPQLRLPLRVGLAFVPSNRGGDTVLSEATKQELLEIVKSNFKNRDYVAHIEIIPDTYLRSGRGFDSMQQVAKLYGVDVMALVSYDQVAALGDKKSALLYWTIVGAYFIEGTENQVQTFVDTAVFDVSTRKLLFRAPGLDKSEKSSTLNEMAEVMRDTRQKSFRNAMTQMTANLETELDSFEKRIKDNPAIATVSWKEGSKGGSGSLNWLILALLTALYLWRRKARVATTAEAGRLGILPN